LIYFNQLTLNLTVTIASIATATPNGVNMWPNVTTVEQRSKVRTSWQKAKTDMLQSLTLERVPNNELVRADTDCERWCLQCRSETLMTWSHVFTCCLRCSRWLWTYSTQ